MHLLHLYAGNLYGGVERVLATLARQRHCCPEMCPHFGLCFDGRLARELRDAGCPPTMLGEARVSRPWTVAAARARLGELLERQQFDAAICHSYWPHGMFAPVVRSRKIPLVYWAHDVPTGKGWLERWARRTRPDLVLANSQFTTTGVTLLFPNAPVVVQRYPVAAPSVGNTQPLRAKVRARLNCPDDACVIVVAARLEPWKGHTLLLDALALLPLECNWRCWIAGGPQRLHEEAYLLGLRAQASHAGIADRVQFLGQREDISEILAGADVHCQPNTGPEPFGIAFVEALAAGLPVVTTNLGGAVEIVDQSCGLVVERDSQSVAAALRMLLDSTEMRRRLGSAGPARADALCDPQQVLRSLQARLGKLIQHD